MIESWSEVKTGDTLHIRDPEFPTAGSYRLVVEKIKVPYGVDVALVTGYRINENGRRNGKVTRREWALFRREVADVEHPG
jgi:hypothetical protein